MKRLAAVLVIFSVAFLAGCDANPVEPPPSTTRPGVPALPPGLEVPPGSELERRINGTCIPFDPWQDGSGRTVCVMTTPQNGTLGRLTTEGEGLDAAAATITTAPIAANATWPYVANGRGLNEAKPPQGELDAAATYQATGFTGADLSDLMAVKSTLASPVLVTKRPARPGSAWLAITPSC